MTLSARAPRNRTTSVVTAAGPSDARRAEFDPILATPPQIAVAARLAEGVAGEQKTWAFEQALRDGVGKAVIGASGVAHRREAAPQHRAHHDARLRTDI